MRKQSQCLVLKESLEDFYSVEKVLPSFATQNKNENVRLAIILGEKMTRAQNIPDCKFFLSTRNAERIQLTTSLNLSICHYCRILELGMQNISTLIMLAGKRK